MLGKYNGHVHSSMTSIDLTYIIIQFINILVSGILTPKILVITVYIPADPRWDVVLHAGPP